MLESGKCSWIQVEKQSGFGLVELLVSFIIGLLVMQILFDQYLQTKKQFIQIQSELEASFDLQMIDDLMRQSTRSAGFTPCLNINRLKTIDRRNGNENLISIAINSTIYPKLQINRMNDDFTLVKKIISPTQILIETNQRLNTKHPVLIADCYSAEVHNIKSMTATSEGQLLELKKPIAFEYKFPMYLGEWVEETFFIQKGVLGQNSLFYKAERIDELSSMVKQMQVKIENGPEGDLIHIILALSNDHYREIDVRVRSS